MPNAKSHEILYRRRLGRPGRARRRSTSSIRRPKMPSHDVALGSKADVDKAVAAARAAFETFSAHDARGAHRAAGAGSSRSTRSAAPRTSAPPSPTRWARRRRWPSDARPAPASAICMTTLEVLKNYQFEEQVGSAIDRARADRRGRHDHAVELAAQPDRLQGRAGARRRLHHGAEAVARSRRSTPSSSPRSCTRPACRRACSTWSTASAPTSAQAMSRASRHRHDVVHRLDPRRHRLVAKAAADTVKRVRQELGGKSAEHHPGRCRSRQGRRRAASAHCFNNSGQSCNAPTRMLVPRGQMTEAAGHRQGGGRQDQGRAIRKAAEHHARPGGQPASSGTRSRA